LSDFVDWVSPGTVAILSPEIEGVVDSLAVRAAISGGIGARLAGQA
jgi:hypothetical protein